MALERQSIEKRDFPIGRRGYDPEAVDAHLSRLADEIEEFRRSSRRRAETLASAASDQVRAIVEAAESSAAEIQRQAEEEAQDIRAEASSEAQATREQATGQAREYVGKVSESTAVMLQRLDAMEGELSGLIESLRTGSNRLNADLQLLEGNLTEVRDAVQPRPRFEPEAGQAAEAVEASEPQAAETSTYGEHGFGGAPPPVAPPPSFMEGTEEPAAPADQPAEHGGYEQESVYAQQGAYGEQPSYGEPVAGQASDPATEVQPAADEASAGGSDDTEGARLIALNMALNGTPREETDRYLAENFQLADRGRLLDEVYASVEG